MRNLRDARRYSACLLVDLRYDFTCVARPCRIRASTHNTETLVRHAEYIQHMVMPKQFIYSCCVDTEPEALRRAVNVKCRWAFYPSRLYFIPGILFNKKSKYV